VKPRFRKLALKTGPITRDQRRSMEFLHILAYGWEAAPECPNRRRKKRSPKRVLALPDLEQTKSAVLNSLTSKSGQRSYDHAINKFVDWYCSEPRLAFNRTVVLRYRIFFEQKQLAATTINLRLAAVRCVAYEAADSGLLSQEAAASIRRVKGVRRIGVRTGNWLSTEEGKRLLQAAQVNTLARKARLRYVGVVDRLRLKAAVSCSDWTASRYRFEKSIG
jgi:hypothetical protein